MKIKLNFKSPFITGGIKLTNNYIESMDYIKGNVVRAAFAKFILENCSEFKEEEEIIVDGVKRKNWVTFRDGKRCKKCLYKNLCKKFSTMKFSFFYPEGVQIIPITAMRCKENEEHGFIDCLIDEKVCKKCPDGNGRVEGVTGYLKNNEDYNVKKMFLTKNQIDKYTETSKDGRLYSLVCVSETESNATKENSKNIFEGYIEGIEQDDIKNIDELRLGSYISIGFGKCSLICCKKENVKKDKIVKRMKDFSSKYSKFQDKKDSLNYVCIKFISDTKMNFQLSENYITTEEYMKKWKEALKINEEYEIEKVFAETFNFRGYDMSKISEDKREETCVMVKKGSVIVFKTQKAFEDIYNDFSTIKGFGLENENGFGDYEFYFGQVF
ncbi:hypothetical protein CLOACE_04650 [Clostridium acetireducens DSM 10703]|uniref:RAMP superfamily protein n=1 Tax=Clostridium acetireducens DSM 10703 TaxID=1121290 RepID=A0A1E8F0V6_9CLOT|nr:hypothetical protein [Clostridium acetireducens]OFI07060.1 hypothetical protein CLOACE_04650 [Clostridium acetireducens DSM 10703]